VLDIPCGAGRLLPLLKKRGFKVTGADVSANMIEEARRYAGPEGENCLEKTDDLLVANIMETKFKDKQFDAVISNRLFQYYFAEPQVRQHILKELKRITSGPIIMSFVCNWSIDSAPFYLQKLFGRVTRRCLPISCTTFAKDILASGLVVERWIPMWPFFSKRWYVLLKQDTAVSKPGFFSAYKSVLLALLGHLAVIAAVILLIWYFSSILK
jgi:SAM-dependent methyltransferase